MRSILAVSALAALAIAAPFVDARRAHHLKTQHSDVASVQSTLPYSVGLLRQPFFDALVVDGIEVLSKLVSTVEIPEVNEHVGDVPVLGAIDLTLNEIEIVRLDADSSLSSIQIRDGFVQGAVRNLQLEIRAHWHYRKSHWPHISGSGHAKITSKNGKIDLNLAAAFDEAGLVNIALSNVAVDLNKFDIDVTDGNASWLYNVIFDIFNGSLKKAIAGAVTDALNSSLPPLLNTLFQQQPLDLTLFGDKVHLNTQFYGSGPTVQSNPAIIVASDRLEFSNVNLESCPYAGNLDPAFPPVDSEPNASILALVDLNLIKCLAWSVRTSDAFSFRATPDILPDGIAVLTVEAWEDVFPAVANRYYRDDYNLVITLAADPELSVNPVSGLTASITINADWFVAATASHPEVYAMSTEITIKLSTLFDIKQDFATGMLHLGVQLDADSVEASGRIVNVDSSFPRTGFYDDVFDETLGDLAGLLGAVAGGLLGNGFDLVEIPVARLRNPKIVFDDKRGALGLATQLSLIPLYN